MKYKISVKNQFKALRPLIYGTIIFGIVMYVFYRNDGFDIDPVIIGCLFFLFLSIPALFLHLEYYLINKNEVVDIDAIQETISFDNQKPIPFKDITKILLVMPPVLYRNGTISFTAFDNYHYAIIKTAEGKQLIFTSLMSFRVETVMQTINGIPIAKVRRFIASPILNRYWSAFWE